MTYIPSSGSGAGHTSPVAFDANDLFCWMTDEASGVTSFPNRVPGGATATLTNSTASMFAGQPSAVGTSEFSLFNNYNYRDSNPVGAASNTGPTNNFTVDWYFKPTVRSGGTAQNHWVWKKMRQAFSAVADDCTLGFYLKYPSSNSYEMIDWEARVRLTSGNTCTMSPSSFTTDGRMQAFALTAMHWHHIGMTVTLSGANTILAVYLDGSPVITSDNGLETRTGTAVDWSTSFNWELFGSYSGGSVAFRGAQGWIQRLRVSNVVRPASYFRDAFYAIR